MLQVRWNLKPTSVKTQSTKMASFDPIHERRKAHRDFELVAQEVGATTKKQKRAMDEVPSVTRGNLRGKENNTQSIPLHKSVLPDFESACGGFDVEASSDTMSSLAPEFDIDILDVLDGADIEYSAEPRETQTDLSLKAGLDAQACWACLLALPPSSTPLSSASRTHLRVFGETMGVLDAGNIVEMSENEMRMSSLLYQMPELE